MIPIKTPEDIKTMGETGKIASKVINEVIENVKPGITTLDLEKIAVEELKKAGAKASFKMVDGYDYATCINVNAGIVHGVPSNYKLKKGDIVSVDMGAFYNGFHSDLSYTVEVGSNTHKEFLDVGKRALDAAIKACKVGNHTGDVGRAIQKIVEKEGHTVSKDLVGHGIGKDLHEEPLVPGYGKPDKGVKIKEGMVFAIEVIYQKGSPDLSISDDGWTIETSDGSLAALFEHTVAVTKNGPKVLTL